jgi:uncharacterized protein (DUF983 family)
MSGAAGTRRSTADPVSAPAPAQAAWGGLCPACGAPTLFAGTLRFADRCPACGLDYTQFNVGDGPAAFLTLVIGGLIAGLAIWLELAASPPWWVHALIWLPVTIIGVMLSLRVAKASLLALEYRNEAREGRIAR